jgi:hypothetical protein
MHAQTAMIENGFLHLPKKAAWLAEYLHELSVFPKGKHDDQVDRRHRCSTGSSRPAAVTPNPGIWHLYKQQYKGQPASASENPRPEPLSVMAKRSGLFRW